MFKSPTSVQLDPSHDSAFATLGSSILPPIAKADVLLTPDPDNCFLPLFKSATSVHAEPFHDSVIATLATPPKANADVRVAVPPN